MMNEPAAAAANLPPVEDRLADLLRNSAAYSRPCKACGEMLYFIQHPRTLKMTPYTKEGINHFANCPEAKQFKKPSGRQT